MPDTNASDLSLLAHITGYTERRLQQLVKNQRPDGKGPVVVKRGRNQYDFLRTINGLFMYLHALQDAAEGGQQSEVQQEKTRLMAAQRKRQELAAAVIGG